jgi:hypothetical protein
MFDCYMSKGCVSEADLRKNVFEERGGDGVTEAIVKIFGKKG